MIQFPGFIPYHGNYRELISYQKAELIYDITFRFCRNFLPKSDRTVDQMIQAARSEKQNIVEGTQASRTSRETEIKLLNVARASLEELLVDYKDFLRVRDFPLWEKDSREAQYVRNLDRKTPGPVTFDTLRPILETRPPETIANIAICLIHQANYLLDRQIRRAEAEFVIHGGIREQMKTARLKYRKQNNSKS